MVTKDFFGKVWAMHIDQYIENVETFMTEVVVI